MAIKKSQFENYNQFLEQYYKNAGLDSANIIGSTQRGSLTGAEMQSNAINLNEAAIARAREDTGYQRQVADMQNAGLNVALMYANGATPGSTTSGASAVGSSNNISQLSGLPIQEVISAMKAPLEMKIMKHQDEMAEDKNNAEIGNIVADTQLKKHQAESVSNQTEWFVNSREYERDFLDLRNQGMRDASALNSANISKIEAEIPEIQARIRLLAEQVDSEEYRRALMSAQANLAHVQAREIVEMLPYAQALSSAQEKNQRANAAVAFLQAGYNARLFTDEFVQATINSAIAQSQNQMTQAELNACRVWQQQFQNNLRASATQPPSTWYDLPHAFTYTLGTMLYGAADLMGSGLGGLVSKGL